MYLHVSQWPWWSGHFSVLRVFFPYSLDRVSGTLNSLVVLVSPLRAHLPSSGWQLATVMSCGQTTDLICA